MTLFAGRVVLARVSLRDGGADSKIAVSVEMEASAHQTLMLKFLPSFAKGIGVHFRAYYNYCNRSDAHCTLASFIQRSGVMSRVKPVN